MKITLQLMLVSVLVSQICGFWLLSKKKVDCTITHWGGWGACNLVKTANAHYKQRIRYMTQPENGGNPCPANIELKDTKKCEESEVMASVVMSSFVSVKKAAASGSSSRTISGFQSFMSRPSTICPNITIGGFEATGNCFQSNPYRRKRSTPQVVQAKFEKHRDVLFLLDESGSIGPTDFKQVKRLAAAFVRAMQDALAPGRDRTRIGLATFDEAVHDIFNFDDFFEKSKIELNINGAPYTWATSGGTCMKDAFLFARDDMFTPARGIRSKAISEKLIIMITDGCDNCATANELKMMRQSLDVQDISVFTIHIGDVTRSSSCLEKLKALNDGSRCFQYFNLKTMVDVGDFITALEENAIGISTWAKFSDECQPNDIFN